jgi:sugar lactone lactonase YvrE
MRGFVVRARLRAIVVGAVVLGAGALAPAAASAFTPGGLVVSDATLNFSTGGSVGRILGVDPTTGTRSIVSANDMPAGPPALAEPALMAFEADGDLLVPDLIANQLVRIAPDGSRTVVSSATVGTGPPISAPSAVLVDSDGSILMTNADPFVLRIDPVTGNRTAVSSTILGTGPTFSHLIGIARSADGTLIVADPSAFGSPFGLYRIDPATGNRTVIASAAVGTGPAMSPVDIAFAASGELIVSNSATLSLGPGGIVTTPGSVMRVDPATGNRTILSSNEVGTGSALIDPAGFQLEPDGDILLADAGSGPPDPSPAAGRIFRIDPATGNRTVVSANDAPAGAPQFNTTPDVLIVPTPAGGGDYPATVQADGPVGYWRFGEPSGTIAHDETGNHNDGTYLNNPLLGVAGALTGDTNTAVRMDGVNDYVRVLDSNSLDVGNTFTLEGWVKRTSATKAADLLVKGFQLTLMSAANGNQLWLRKPNVSTVARTAGGVPADGAYHHIAVTKSGSGAGAVKFYVDGVAVSTVDVAPAQVIQNTAGSMSFSGAGSAAADFDEFAIYPTALSAARIAAHYAAGHPGT